MPIIVMTFENNITITDEAIIGENFTYTRSISSNSSLKYGGCESASISVRLKYDNTTKNLAGKSFGCTYNGKALGLFWVYNSTVSDNRRTVEITAYDFMQKMKEKSAVEFVNNCMASTVQLTFGDAWRNMFGENYLDYGYVDKLLCNDNQNIPDNSERMSDGDNFTYYDFIKVICEYNGVFGYITNGNKFAFKEIHSVAQDYHYPATNLYPANNLYPFEQQNYKEDNYYSLSFEDYEVPKINRVWINYGNNKKTYAQIIYTGETIIPYEISANKFSKFFELSLATALSYNLTHYLHDNAPLYRPIKKASMPHDDGVDIGDNVRFYSIWGDVVDTVVLSIKTSGVYAIKDTIVSKGAEGYNQ